MKTNFLHGTACLLLDGATGSNLMEAGMPHGVCVESWVLEHPEVLQELQRRFVEAGSQLVLTPTFGANRARLARFGLENRVRELNLRLAALTREAVGSRALVAGDVSPSGQFCEPFGTLRFEELVELYAEQICALREAGADLIVAETMMGLDDARAAVLAAREAGLPAVASMTLDEHGRTLSGGTAAAAVLSLQAAGAAAVGFNCSTGPVQIAAFLKGLRPYLRVPLLAKPNAGTPQHVLGPEEFARACADLRAEGVSLFGGCCQSTPEHIAALAAALSEGPAPDPAADAAFEAFCRTLGAPAGAVPVSLDGLPLCTERKIFEDTTGVLHPGTPIACGDGLEDALLDAGEEAGVLFCAPKTTAEAARLARAAASAAQPLAVCTEDAEVLQTVLRAYPGRAAAVCADEKTRAAAFRYGARVLVP